MKNYDNLRSDKVRHLLNSIPKSLIRCGYCIMLVMFIVILLVICFMPFPHGNGENILSHIISSIK